jgi:hypothetical protein
MPAKTRRTIDPSRPGILTRLRGSAAFAFGPLARAVERGPGRIVAAGSLLAAGAVGIALFSAYGVPALRAAAERRAEREVAGPLTVGFSHLPSWLDGSVAREIAADAELALVGAGASPFDAAPLALVRERLDRSGWFVKVEQVRRIDGGRLEAEVEFRKPFALVRWEGEDHLVGTGGERMPLVFLPDGPRPTGLPLVTGASLPPPKLPGAAWIGQDLHAALHLAARIHRKPWFAAGQVTAIDASRFAGEGILELVTDRGDRLVWGGDPEERNLGEMPADEKLRCLDTLWHHYRRVDGGARGLDLRFDVVTRPEPRRELAVGTP